jgi:hypothetical protein
MFYGIIHEEYLYEDYVLQEIDFKGAIDTVKKKVKNAIISFIRKIEGLLSKGKDNKIKSALRSLLQKVRKLLGDTENIETEADAKKINNSLNEYREELKEIEHEYVGTLTWDNLRSWLRENMKEDGDHGLIIYRPDENVGVTSGKILKFIKKEDKYLKIFKVDPHIIHLIVYNEVKDKIIARKDIGFNKLELKTQEILKQYAARNGVVDIKK